MPRKDDSIIGRKFGRLIVVRFHDKKNNERRFWCQCECGNEKAVRRSSLVKGATVSCGCFLKEKIHEPKKHGFTSGGKIDPLFYVWQGMIARCTNPNHKSWKNYGGRGINVCDSWRYFSNFVKDMGRPEKGMTLDRIDVNQEYGPGNCKWSSRSEQGRNKTNNAFITWNGKTQSMMAWAEELNVSYSTLRSRRQRGWTVEEMMSVPFTGNARESQKLKEAK